MLGFFDLTGFDQEGQSCHAHEWFFANHVACMRTCLELEVIVLIGTLFSNQKDVSQFLCYPKNNWLFGVPNFERQAVDMNMKGDTFRVMFWVKFGMITTMILETRMLTAISRIGGFQLIIFVSVWKGMKKNMFKIWNSKESIVFWIA